MKLEFSKWVLDNGGPNKVGKRLGVTGAAVRMWTRGSNNPKAATMLKIHIITGISINQLIRECTRNAD